MFAIGDSDISHPKERLTTVRSEKFTKIIVWCEDEECSIPLQVEQKAKVNTQGKDQLLQLGVSCRLAIFR